MANFSISTKKLTISFSILSKKIDEWFKDYSTKMVKNKQLDE